MTAHLRMVTPAIPEATAQDDPPPPISALPDRLAWGAARLGGKRALAAAADISEAQLYRYMEGEAAIPHDKLSTLALAFGANPAWLLTGRGHWQAPTNRERPEFQGQLLQELNEQMGLLLVEYQRPFPPPLKSRLLRYLYETLRHNAAPGPTPLPNKFKLLQYVSFLDELRTEAELDVLQEAFDVLEYRGLGPDYQAHHQLLTTWCNLLTRGLRGYYNSHAGQVYYERMGQALTPEATRELHDLVSELLRLTGKKQLNWLDIGCGNGRHLTHLHKFMPNLALHGLELSDLGQKYCRQLEQSERLPAGCVQGGDIRLAPYASGTFDVAFAHLSLMELPYLPGTGLGVEAALEEIQRILKPSGLLALTVPSGQGFNYKLPRQLYSDALVQTLFDTNGWRILNLHKNDGQSRLNTANTGVPSGLKLPHEETFSLIVAKK